MRFLRFGQVFLNIQTPGKIEKFSFHRPFFQFCTRVGFFFLVSLIKVTSVNFSVTNHGERPTSPSWARHAMGSLGCHDRTNPACTILSAARGTASRNHDEAGAWSFEEGRARRKDVYAG